MKRVAVDAASRLRDQVRITPGAMRGLPAPAKLNVFLHVVGRRDDGLHLLQTVFRFIDLADTIDVVVLDRDEILRERGMPGLDSEQDLAVRAARLLKQATGCRLGAAITVTKQVPAGGGLGGGSSDAATVLLALNRLWGLGLSRAQLQALGLQLGADVPVFVFGRNAFAEGVGERLTPVELPAQHYLLVHPGVMVPTATIFTDPGLTRNTPPVTLASFSEAAYARAGGGGIGGAGVFGRNDLEPVAMRRFREVREALAWLSDSGRAAGAIPRMSGSGGCCFLPVDAAFRPPAAPQGMSAWLTEGLSEHPLLALFPD